MYSNDCKECSSGSTSNELCKNCLSVKMLLKFKTYFSKQKFRFDKNILVVYSKSTTSLALLHLLKEITDGSPINNPVYEIFCLYINENSIDDKLKTEQDNSLNNLMREVEDFNFKYYIASMSDFFANEKEFIKPFSLTTMKCDSKNEKLLESFLKKSPDSTAKQELLDKLRKKLIVTVSKKLNCNIVLLDNVATNLAAQIVSNIVLGHGVSISLKNYSVPKKNSRIRFLYPMQNFITDEINSYLKCKNSTNIKFEESSENKLNKTSIQDITKNFIYKLDDINLTTSTICKLSEKISSENEKKSSDFCICCKKLIQIPNSCQILSTEFAKCFSEHVSTFKKTAETLTDLFDNINNKNKTKPITYNNLTLNCYNYNQSSDHTVTMCYACKEFLCKYGYKAEKINN